MVFAVPQMQTAILEWRANWLGLIDKHKLEAEFQGIHDYWVAQITDKNVIDANNNRPVQTEGLDRIPGEWIKFHPIDNMSKVKLLSSLFITSKTRMRIEYGRYGTYPVNNPLTLPHED